MRKIDYDLLVITPNLESGGAEKVAVSIAGEAAQRRRKVALVCLFSASGALRSSVDSNVEVIVLQGRSVLQKIMEMRRMLVGYKGEILSCQRKTNVYIGLVTLTLRPAYYKLLYREASTFDAINNRGILKRLCYTLLLRFTYLLADKIIANSCATKRDVQRCLAIKDSRILAIPNPVLPSYYEELVKQPLDDSFFSPGVKLLINIGRLEDVKGQDILLIVLQRLIQSDDSFRLVLLGSGYLKSSFESIIRENNLRNYVKIVDFSDNVYKYLARSSLYLFSSHWEGFGNVLVESLACGTPIVGFECHGGATEIIKRSTQGTLIKERNVDSMVCEVRAYFGKGAPRDTADVSHYRIDAVYDRYFDA